MPVVGSTITIDFHITEDTDLDSVQAVTRHNERADPDLARIIRKTVEQAAREALDSIGEDYDLAVDVNLVTGRLPGAPRERVTAEFDVEAEKSVLAAVDEAVSAPDRAQMADEVEARVLEHLGESGLSSAVDVIVSVTPIQFR
jgi:hypothetical protein